MSSNANVIGARTCGILAHQKRVTFGNCAVDKKGRRLTLKRPLGSLERLRGRGDTAATRA